MTMIIVVVLMAAAYYELCRAVHLYATDPASARAVSATRLGSSATQTLHV